MDQMLNTDRHGRLFDEIEAGRYKVADKSYAIQAAVDSNRWDMIRKLHQVGTRLIDPHDPQSRVFVNAALDFVHKNNDPRMLQAMAEVGMDINGNKGFPILHEYLDRYKHEAKPEAIEAMGKAGFNLDSKDFLGNTPLHYAAQYGNEEVAGALVKCGAKLEIINKSCDYPLDVAKKHGHHDLAVALENAGRAQEMQGLDFTMAPARSQEKGRGMVLQ